MSKAFWLLIKTCAAISAQNLSKSNNELQARYWYEFQSNVPFLLIFFMKALNQLIFFVTGHFVKEIVISVYILCIFCKQKLDHEFLRFNQVRNNKKNYKGLKHSAFKKYIYITLVNKN